MSFVDLLTSDAEDLGLDSLSPGSGWGIYLNGSPVLQPASPSNSSPLLSIASSLASLIGVPNLVPATASTIDFEYGQDWPISNYPQEQGAFQSYNKVTLPFDVKVHVASGGSPSARQAFLSTCLAIANSLSLFDVVTPEMTFTSVCCSHIDWRRSADRGQTLIVVDLWFQLISVSASTGFSNTQQPGESSQQALGSVQAQQPSTSVTNSISVGGVGGSSISTIPGS
jgi:hypothetical protein